MSHDTDHQNAIREAAGMITVGLADELARPLDEIRDLLASVVDALDTHVASAKGPDALSYEKSKVVRESIASAFLKCANTARLATDLAGAVRSGAVEPCDLNKLIDDALSLVRHRFSAATDLFVDLGSVPPVPLVGGEMVLALSRILLYCADSTRSADEAAVSVRSRLAGSQRSEVSLTIAENGRGASTDEISMVTRLARSMLERLGGSVTQASEPGSGATFELRIPL